MSEIEKNRGVRYLELTRKLAKEGGAIGDAEADEIYAEMMGILLSLPKERREDLLKVADHERRRVLARMGVPKDAEPWQLPFRFLCRIPRTETTNLATAKIGPGWLSYLKSRGILVPFRNLVIVNDPDDTNSFLAYHVEAGRLF